MFLSTLSLEVSLFDPRKKKKTYFEKKYFSTPVTISGPDPGTDSGESKQLIFVLTFVVFSSKNQKNLFFYISEVPHFRLVKKY